MTLAEIESQLSGWYVALQNLQTAASYTIGGVRNGRTLTRADLPEVRATIDWLEQKKTQAQNGGQIRIRKVTL
jgi:hypothetical protein